jgi:hypothetical protein
MSVSVVAEALSRETGQSFADPAKLVGPMLARFMATDRAFIQARRNSCKIWRQRIALAEQRVSKEQN